MTLPVGVTIESMAVTFAQEEDCAGRAGAGSQSLEISTADGGAGHYIVLKTERWAVDDIAELATICQQVMDIANGGAK